MTDLTATVEHHPENGDCPWVAVLRGGPFDEVWIAFPTKRAAEEKASEILEQCPSDKSRDFVEQLGEIIKEVFPDEPMPFVAAAGMARRMKERGMLPYA